MQEACSGDAGSCRSCEGRLIKIQESLELILKRCLWKRTRAFLEGESARLTVSA